jgi:hypothetical protein
MEPAQIQRFGARECDRNSFHVQSECYNPAMKPTFLILVALAITPPLMAATKHHAPPKKEAAPAAAPTNFSVKGADGSVKNYSLEIPAALPPAPAGTTSDKISQQAAVLAALGWAPGFYGSTSTTAISVDFLSDPTAYYLVHLTGKVGDSTQPLYAAVLSDGRIVRPSATTAPMKETKTTHKKAAKKAK